MQRRPAALARLGVDGGAHFGIGLRQGVEPADQRPVVEHRAADDQRDLASRQNFSDRPDRLLAPAARGIAAVRIDDIDQVMRHGRALGGARLGGADVEAAIHLRRVHRHDLERRALGELECQA